MKEAELKPAVIGLVLGVAFLLTWSSSDTVSRLIMPRLDKAMDAVRTQVQKVSNILAGSLEVNSMPDPGRAAVIVAADTLFIGVDACGRTVWKDRACEAVDLPVVTGCQVSPSSFGDSPGSPEVTLALSIYDALRRLPLLLDLVSELNVEEIDNPRLVLCGGIVVDVGRGNYMTKFRRLAQVWLQSKKLGIKMKRIDLRFAGQVIVEPVADQKQNHEGV